MRDDQWSKIVASYKGKKTYKAIAKEWAKKHAKETAAYFLKHMWNSPKHTENYWPGAIHESFLQMKAEGKAFESFMTEQLKNMESILKSSAYLDYIEFNLPRIIRSAVARYKT
jgi:hypothetical protein